MHYKYNTVHLNVLCLFLHMWRNWKIETNNKETCQIKKKKWKYNEAVYQLFIYFKKACDSVRGEIMYNILIEFCIHIKLVRLIKMCLTETYSRFWVFKYLSDIYPIKIFCRIFST
jgi:hypothetical protein